MADRHDQEEARASKSSQPSALAQPKTGRFSVFSKHQQKQSQLFFLATNLAAHQRVNFFANRRKICQNSVSLAVNSSVALLI